jgi:hypothetical protein
MKVTINAGAHVVIAPGANLVNLEQMTIHPGGSITINNQVIQNNTLYPIIKNFNMPVGCKPIVFDKPFNDYDDHDGSAPLMGITDLPLVEAY